MTPAPLIAHARILLTSCYAERMTASTHLQPPLDKPTPPIRSSRLAWAVVSVAILALLFVCVALILIAAWRGP
jgi:hypothetical protein